MNRRVTDFMRIGLLLVVGLLAAGCSNTATGSSSASAAARLSVECPAGLERGEAGTIIAQVRNEREEALAVTVTVSVVNYLATARAEVICQEEAQIGVGRALDVDCHLDDDVVEGTVLVRVDVEGPDFKLREVCNAP